MSDTTIHNRMPIILQDTMLGSWVSDADFAEWYVHEAMPEMMAEKVTV